MSGHAASAHFRLSDDSFGTEEQRQAIQNLGGQIGRVLEDIGLGEFDGDVGHPVLFCDSFLSP